MYLPLKRNLPNNTSKIPPIAAMAVILLGWEVVSISGIGLFCSDHLPPEIVQLCGDVNVTVALNGMYLEMLCVQAKVRFVESVIKTSPLFFCVDIQTACTIHGQKCGEDVTETQQTKRTIRERAFLIAQSGRILMFLLIGQ